MVVLLAIVAWKTHRLLGIAYTAFAVVIQIGAVHLGWHYAIDGYVSAVCVPALWWAVGRGLRAGERRRKASHGNVP